MLYSLIEHNFRIESIAQASNTSSTSADWLPWTQAFPRCLQKVWTTFIQLILACTCVSDFKDGKENTSPHMSYLRNIAHKCSQSRFCDGFHACLNIAGIDPSFSWEQTVLLEVFIQPFEHKTGSCTINQCTYSCPN